jgi:hypothetical protein
MFTKAIAVAYAAMPAAVAAALCLGALGLMGCHRAPPPESAKVADTAQPASKQEAETEDAAQSVTLTAEQAEKMGVATEPAKPLEYTAETSGFGIVIAHDAIATAVAELATAQAAARQSRAALERAQRLSGTPGAMSADAVESATRQAETDSAALTLGEQRLTTIIGSAPAGVARNGPVLRELAGGKIKLLRATFPLGALEGSRPATLRAARLVALSPGVAHPAEGWSLDSVWPAPADASLPGRSFFGLLKDADAGEGERLLVWAPGTAPSQRGVVVPAASLVISEAKYWCYVETKSHVYVRRQIDTGRPVADGYFVTEGIAAGDKVVTAAAGLLLARETNSGSEPD